jgi:hypothetical protein
MPMFTLLGYGLRFGPGLAWFSALAGVGLMVLGFQVSPYWRALPVLSAGVCLATLAHPG